MVLFTSGRKMEKEVDRQFVVVSVVITVKERAEPHGKALDSLVCVRSSPHLMSSWY